MSFSLKKREEDNAHLEKIRAHTDCSTTRSGTTVRILLPLVSFPSKARPNSLGNAVTSEQLCAVGKKADHWWELLICTYELRCFWTVCAVLPSGGKGGCITKFSFWKRRHHGHCLYFILRYFQWKYSSQSKGCLTFPPVILFKSVQISRSGICSGKILWTWEGGVETFQTEWNYNYWTKPFNIIYFTATF